MAYEDYLASQAWRNLPPAQFNTGLLGQGQAPTPTNYYQQIMQQMAAEPANVTGTPRSAGGYKPGIFSPRTVEEMVDELNALNAAGGGGRSAAEQQRINEFFDAMTPAELAEFQKKNADFINKLLTPMPLQLADLAAKKMGYAGFLPFTLGDGLLGDGKQGVVTVGEGEAVADGDGITAPSYGVISNSGLLGLSGISGPGMASTTPGNAVSSAMGGQAAAAASGGGGGSSGGGRGAPGAPGLGVNSGGGFATGPGGTAGVGGTGSGSSACCFIMLEARYGDGTMDAVVRRYRDEKMTDKNRRGYYKLAEVFVPLMRESRIFKFFVAKTFADPLVSYGKYHYGENKHGWLFKPVEKFWMKVFNTLGTDTKFIRENGETV